MRKTYVVLSAAAVLVLAAAIPSMADPPSVVGRLSLVTGSVSLQPGTLDDWVPAVANYPLTAGDQLWTAPGGRAEVHVGSTALRMDAGTAMSFLSLDDQTLQVQLSQGTLTVRVRQMDAGDTVEIDTPNSVVTLLEPGLYRVDASNGSEVDLDVRDGSADVVVAADDFSVGSGTTAHISGPDSVVYWLQAVPAPDAWDTWSASRDAREDSFAAANYAPRGMIGIEDLDENGAWITVPGQGVAWYPTAVPAGWAPYRLGRWAWVEPWGWTWIDNAAWGFAPFHYGRWSFVQNRWLWFPGVVTQRPVYAPALVVFVGGSAPDEVGWFPLGPREIYVPPYQATATYVQRLNVASVTNITVQIVMQTNVTTVVYANRSLPAAVTLAPRQSLVQSRPILAPTVTRSDTARLPVIGMGVNVAPQRESITGSPAQVAPARPPQDVTSRGVLSRTAPAPAPTLFSPAAAAQVVANPIIRPSDTVPAARTPAAQSPSDTSQAQAPQRPGVTVITRPIPTRPATQPTTQPAATAPATQPATQPAVATPATQPTTPSATQPSAQQPQVRANTADAASQLSSKIVPDVSQYLEDARKIRGITLSYPDLKQQLDKIRQAVDAAAKATGSARKDLTTQQLADIQKQLRTIVKTISDAVKAAKGNLKEPDLGDLPSGDQGRNPQPTAQAPATQAPTAQPAPAAQQPAAQQPAAQQPVAQSPAAQPPAATTPTPAVTTTAATAPAATTPAATTPAATAPTATTPAAQPNTRGGGNTAQVTTSLSRKIVPDVLQYLEDAKKIKGITLSYADLKQQLEKLRQQVDAAVKPGNARKDLTADQLSEIQKQLRDIVKTISDAVKSAGGNLKEPDLGE